MKKLFLLLVAVLSVSLCAFAQTRTVTGTVVDNADDEPIAGASIVPVGANKGVITDADGNFTIVVPAATKALQISYIGYASQTVQLGKGPVHVRLNSSIETKDEVIVVAYGTTTKGAYTGSAGVVGAAELENVQVANVTNALSGKIAGVQTLSSNGQPGTGSTVLIRGVGSINASTSPLYVVDGMPLDGDISSIPTSDIESMTVLKDAASTALYGARGANGVVLLTTKKGQAGEATVTVEMKWGSNSRALPNYDVVTDARQYLETVYQGLVGAARYEQDITDPVALHAYGNNNLWDAIGYQTWTIPAGEYAIGTNGKFNPNATPGYTKGNYYFLGDDWAKETFIHGLRQEYNLSVSGGTDRIKYYIAGSYLGDEGIITSSHFNRFNTRANVDYQAKKWLKIGANMSYTYSNTGYPSDQTLDYATSIGNAFNLANSIAPVYPFYVRLAKDKQIAYNETYGNKIYDYGDGADYGWGPLGFTRNTYGQANAVGGLTYDTSDILSDIFDGKWYAILTPLKGLTLTANVGTYVDNTRNHTIQNGVYGQFADAGGYVSQEQVRVRSNNLQFLGQYDLTVAKDHNFSVMVGFENSSYREEVLWGNGANLYNPQWPYLDNVIDDKNNGGYEYSLVHRGFFGRLRYDYAGKYYVTGSFRRDGSSRFAPDRRWGSFWSASAGWDISKENFLKEYSDIIDILKFKFSYGQNGNDGIGSHYLAYADQYKITGGDGVWNDATLYYKGNPEVTWEKSDAINTGFDFSFWKGMLSGTIEYYQRTVSDMLFNLPVAPSLGYNSIPSNVGKMRNAGFEFDFTYRPVNTRNITLDINANLTTGWNRVLKLDSKILNNHESWQLDSKEAWVTGNRMFVEGKSMYNLYIAEWAGVNPETGAPQWYTWADKLDADGNKIPYLWNTDENGNATTVKQYVQERVITENYSEASKISNRISTGNLMPKGYGGFGFDLHAYGFQLSANFAYQFGGKLLDYGYQNFTSFTASTVGTNVHKDVLNAWTENNKTSNFPRLDLDVTSTNNPAGTSTRYLISSNYLSLNNLTVGYDLPAKWLANMHLKSCRVYFMGENLALWSKRKGMDPRQGFTSSENLTYSPMRVLSGGIKVSF